MREGTSTVTVAKPTGAAGVSVGMGWPIFRGVRERIRALSHPPKYGDSPRHFPQSHRKFVRVANLMYNQDQALEAAWRSLGTDILVSG